MGEPIMPVGRFLELLNLPTRTQEQEAELKTELLRRAQVESTAQVAKPEEPQTEVPTEPSVSVEPVTPTDTQASTPVEAGYSLTQLSKEITDAVSYLKTQKQTLAIEMATAAFVQARYWLSLEEK